MEIQYCRPERFNSNNHHERRPFIVVNGILKVDPKAKWLLELFPDAVLEDITIPCMPINDPEWSIYLKIMDSYSLRPNTWGNLHWAKDKLQIIPIPFVDHLHNLVHINNYRNLNEDDFEIWHKWIPIVETALNIYPDGAFIKLSEKSPKNGLQKMKPCFTFIEIIDLITSSKELIKYLTKEEEYLILAPWKYFDRINEFRVFILDGKIRAISQQDCYTEYGARDVTNQIQLIIEWYEKIQFPYQYATVDVVVENECHLIEINPPGDWGSAGSGLFHWIDDHDIFYNRPVITVRIY